MTLAKARRPSSTVCAPAEMEPWDFISFRNPPGWQLVVCCMAVRTKCFFISEMNGSIGVVAVQYEEEPWRVVRLLFDASMKAKRQ
jgi:hypothetical protein